MTRDNSRVVALEKWLASRGDCLSSEQRTAGGAGSVVGRARGGAAIDAGSALFRRSDKSSTGADLSRRRAQLR